MTATCLVCLKYRIARAVSNAGMDASPNAEVGDPLAAAAAGARESVLSMGSACAEELVRTGHPSALFRGTYGQVMAALDAAGLTAVPCPAWGVSDGEWKGTVHNRDLDADLTSLGCS